MNYSIIFTEISFSPETSSSHYQLLVIGPDSLYCDLDLDPTMPVFELVLDIYYNVFQFHVPRSITFFSYHTHTHTHTHTTYECMVII